MKEKTITIPQIHFRGIPGPKDRPYEPGSIIEHRSTSLKVTMLRCWSESDRDPIQEHELFDVHHNVVEKTKKKFFYIGKREFDDNFKIRRWENVNLLVPKSSTELRRNNNIELSLWPPVFVCEECNRLYRTSGEEIGKIVKSESFPECHNPNCDGSYRQSPHILQCMVCGSIRHLPTKCIKCNAPLYLRKGSETDIETWRFECSGNPSHITDFNQYHEYWCENDDNIISDVYHEERSDGKKSRRNPITTVGRGIATPLIYRFPIAEEDPRLNEDERLLIASQSHLLTITKYNYIRREKRKFKKNRQYWKEEEDRLFEESGTQPYNEKILASLKKLPVDGRHSGKITYGKFLEIEKMCKNRSIKSFNFSENCDFERLLRRSEEWSDLLYDTIKSKGQPSDLNDLLNKKTDSENLNKIKDKLHFNQIRYVDNIAVITGTYGMIRGSVHPIYKGKTLDPIQTPLTRVDFEKDSTNLPKSALNGRTSFPVIVTKRKTEGIVFTLKSKKILRVIKKIKPAIWKELTSSTGIDPNEYSEEESRLLLSLVSFDENYGEEIREISRLIIHTISHAIIHRFSKVSGLRDEDLSEMLFPEFAGFVIYNGLMNPLGFLRRVFEDSLSDLLNIEIIHDMEECDMDPTCFNQEEGAACHACLHSPEHVCEQFNMNLDRRILIGEDGFWNERS